MSERAHTRPPLPSLARPGSHSFLPYRPPHQQRLSFSAAGRGSSLLVLSFSPAPRIHLKEKDQPNALVSGLNAPRTGLLQWTLCPLWGILPQLS